MAELKTVPSFTFFQNNDNGDYESAIQVAYYIGSIELTQDENTIIISNVFYQSLFKEMKKYFDRAQEQLNK